MSLLFVVDLTGQDRSKDSLFHLITKYRIENGADNPTDTYIDLLNELAKKYRFRDADSIKLLSEEALALSIKINYEKGMAYAMLRKGDFYSESGDAVNAKIEYKKSNRISSKLQFPQLEVEILISMAFQEYLSQKPENAVLMYYEAIELSRKHKLVKLEAVLRHNLGYCFSTYKLYDEAQIEYLIVDSLLSNVEGTNYRRAMTMSNIALNAIDKGDLELASLYGDKSISILTLENEPLWLSRAYRTKSRYFIKKKQYEEALKWIGKSDSVLHFIKNTRDEMEIDSVKSTIYLGLNDYENAKIYTVRILQKAIAIQDSLFQLNSYINLEKIEDLRGSWQNAYEYYKKSKTLKELLKEKNQIQNIVLLRAKNNFNKEKEILRLENLRQKNTQQKYLHWVFAIFVTLLIVIIVIYKTNLAKKRLNNQLKEKADKLIENQIILNKINKSQDKLFSIVGHDLRGPIITLNQLLDQALEDETAIQQFYRFGPKLKINVEHIQFTLDNLLNWGLTQMQGDFNNPVTINVGVQLYQILSLYGNSLDKKRISISKDLPQDIFITGDSNHFNIIFRNLINNAIKFTSKNGNIRVKVKEENNFVIISIRDNGVGMSEDVLNRIFNQSEHYTTFGTNNELGTGLGLVLSKEMILRNNGIIEVESLIGKGSTFIITFPMAFQ